VITLSSSLKKIVVVYILDQNDECVWVIILIQDQVVNLYVVYDPNLNLENCKTCDLMA
jgi:hypothetical protein